LGYTKSENVGLIVYSASCGKTLNTRFSQDKSVQKDQDVKTFVRRMTTLKCVVPFSSKTKTFLMFGTSIAQTFGHLANANLSRTSQKSNVMLSLADRVRRAEMHHHAKFRQNPSIRCAIIEIFQFFKMAAVRHFGFVWGIFGPPTKGTWWSLSLSQSSNSFH